MFCAYEYRLWAVPSCSTHKHLGYIPCIASKTMGQPICSLGTMARLTVYTTQQSVQGTYCAISVVLALQLWVLLMYYRWNLSSYGIIGYNVCYTDSCHLAVISNEFSLPARNVTLYLC